MSGEKRWAILHRGVSFRAAPTNETSARTPAAGGTITSQADIQKEKIRNILKQQQ